MSIRARDLIFSLKGRFRKEKALDFNAIIQFSFTGEPDSNYWVKILEGQIWVDEGITDDPTCIIKSKEQIYVGIELGEVNPQMAMLSRKLKVSNLSQMMQFSKLFRRYKVGEKPNLTADFLERKVSHGPLNGIRILDFTRLLPGPLATMMLADMGADVIKIEDPDSPDYIRDFQPIINGESAYYQSLNCSKRSLALNYSSKEGIEIICKLIKDIDVLIEQFRPGVMKDIGLDYEFLKKINPSLIYISISGYGQDGPYAQKAGHDLNYISYSGLLDTNGVRNSKPVIPGFQVADIAGGSYMVMNACLAALFYKERTGVGQYVDIAMMDAVLPLLSLPYAHVSAGEKNPGRGNWPLSGALANYNVYKCKDDRYMALGALEPKFWDRFCMAVHRPDWKPRILDEEVDMLALKKEVEELFLTETRTYWTKLGEDVDCCLSPVNSVNEVDQDPQLRHREMINKQSHPKLGELSSINTPLKFSVSKVHKAWKAPALGEDTIAILKESGIDDEQISNLFTKGIASSS